MAKFSTNKSEVDSILKQYAIPAQVAMYFFSGPLTARLVERAGTRPVCMVGATISGTWNTTITNDHIL